MSPTALFWLGGSVAQWLSGFLCAFVSLYLCTSLLFAEGAGETEKMRIPLRFDELDSAVVDGGLLRLRREYKQVGKEPLSFEAEEATILEPHSKDRQIAADPETSGGFYVYQVKHMEYHFEVVTPGKYCVWVHAYFPARGNWNHHEALDDGPPQTVVDSDSGEDKRWLWVKETTYPLAAGKHRLVYPSPSAWCGGARLDKVVLAPEGTSVSDMGPKPSPITTGLTGKAFSHRIKVKRVRAWELAFARVENGGSITVEYSYDKGAAWLPFGKDIKLPIEVPAARPRYLYFRFQIAGQSNRPSPWLQALELYVVKEPTPTDLPPVP